MRISDWSSDVCSSDLCVSHTKQTPELLIFSCQLCRMGGNLRQFNALALQSFFFFLGDGCGVRPVTNTLDGIARREYCTLKRVNHDRNRLPGRIKHRPSRIDDQQAERDRKSTRL